MRLTTIARHSAACRRAIALLLATLALTLDGCISKTEIPTPRTFRPVRPAATPAAATSAAPALRLREVTAATHLHEPVCWATAEDEVGAYDDRLWTETPADYVEAALGRQLFVAGRARRAGSPAAPALSVRVAAFEERLGPAHEARVVLRLLLVDRAGDALVEREVTGRAPLADDTASTLAVAMGVALEAAAREVAELAVAGAR
jgi:ABC-type uncharacterized transport system auxiliary subunit